MIAFEHVSKTYPGGVKAVQDFSLEIEEGETLVLLGTSGSGKTTILKMVNRLVEPTTGRVLINGIDVMEQDVIELRRGIGYAIQHIGLFPHMTVEDNIAMVPRLLNWPRGRIRERVSELLAMVGLCPEEYRHRFPVKLSGGQVQRVGVARALAAEPPVVLMDEPFGALDPITREQLQNEFLALQSRIRKTIIFVTHDIYEAVKIGDRVAILDKGSLQQLATPSEMVLRPANDFVEQFLGQQRFHLMLLTRKVGEMKEFQPGSLPRGDGQEFPDHFISDRHSLVEALEVFRQAGIGSLPVRGPEGQVGELAREELLEAIARALGEAEGLPCT